MRRTMRRELLFRSLDIMSHPREFDPDWRASLPARAAGRAFRAITESVEVIDTSVSGVAPIRGYVLVRRLGGGGGGDVFLAFREGSDRTLALKILRRPLGSVQARRAWRELDMLERLRLECVPRLIDHGTDDGRVYIATEFVDGLPLIEFCCKHELKRDARVDLLASIADAVHSLHEFGVIHRDVKPGNILIDDRGLPVLIDLGIATLLSQSDMDTLTLEGAPIGSPAFMSPEQAKGARDAISTRSDVYGLGATAYVVLTGDTPHDMDTALHEAIRRISSDQPRNPRELDPTLPTPLAFVLTKSVSYNPKDRYASAAEFACDLRRWLHHEPVEAGGLSIAQRFGRTLARHPIVVTALVCLSIALACVAGAWASVWWINGRPAEIEVDTQRTRVYLRSYSGRVVHTYRAGHGNRFIKVHKERRDPSLGGGTVVLLGIGTGGEYDPNAQLVAYDFDHPEKELWSTGTGAPQINMPEPISVVEGGMFGLGPVLIEDIFPDIPGNEIVTIHGHTVYSPNLIRIYDLSGRILYQVWHDGQISQCLWIRETGTLVLTGLNSENNWNGRGYSTLVEPRYPMIVLGIHPEVGQVHDEWIHTPGGLGTIEPAFYKCVLPLPQLQNLATHNGIYVTIGRNVLLSKPETGLFAAVLSGAEQIGLVQFVLDSNGNQLELQETLAYKRLRREHQDLPDPSEFYLGDLPPLLIDPRHPDD